VRERKRRDGQPRCRHYVEMTIEVMIQDPDPDPDPAARRLGTRHISVPLYHLERAIVREHNGGNSRIQLGNSGFIVFIYFKKFLIEAVTNPRTKCKARESHQLFKSIDR
jgi:hypothetical protein